MRESTYRRLLWAYPGPYRRRYGDEIVATVAESGDVGRGQALHLILCGLRQRFRLPFKRPLVLLSAVLAAVALGALGASGGTWLGWQAAADVPSADQLRGLTAAMTGGQPSDVSVEPWRTAMRGPAVTTAISGPASSSAGQVRAALASAGWRAVTVTESDVSDAHPWIGAPAREVRFEAVREGLMLRGNGLSVAGSRSDQSLVLWAGASPLVRPLTIAGLLLGALAGWLITAALAYRVRECGRVQRAAVTMLGMAAFVFAVVPAVTCYRAVGQVMTYDDTALDPYVVDGVGGQVLSAVLPAGAGLGLLALLAAVLVVRAGGGRGNTFDTSLK